jgi:murein DD-endopeptidase MepM/ murein hydrolase activator NlpD
MNEYMQNRPVNQLWSQISVKPLSGSNEDDSKASGFGDLLTNLLSTSNEFGANGVTNSQSDLLTPILLMLISKLLGDNQSLFNGELSASEPHGKPLNGTITQRSHSGHTALDFGVPIGTNVQTTIGGKVIHAGWNNEGYGNLVIVENGPFRTYFAHLSKIPVKVGQVVQEGEVIGLSGNTGNSTGPHLHYEIRKNGVNIDPTQSLGV